MHLDAIIAAADTTRRDRQFALERLAAIEDKDNIEYWQGMIGVFARAAGEDAALIDELARAVGDLRREVRDLGTD